MRALILAAGALMLALSAMPPPKEQQTTQKGEPSTQTRWQRLRQSPPYRTFSVLVAAFLFFAAAYQGWSAFLGGAPLASPSIHGPSYSDEKMPLDSPFSIENESPVFTIRNAYLTCTLKFYFPTVVDAFVRTSKFDTEKFIIKPLHKQLLKCGPSQAFLQELDYSGKTLMFFPTKILMRATLHYQIDPFGLNFLAMRREFSSTAFMWSQNGDAHVWTEGEPERF